MGWLSSPWTPVYTVPGVSGITLLHTYRQPDCSLFFHLWKENIL